MAAGEPFQPHLPPNACVRIVGLGGVGGIAARYGAMFLASLNAPCRMVLIDGDRFEPSNATRMFFTSHGNKAAVVRADLRERFAESAMTLLAVEQYITPQNIENVLGPGGAGEIILLAVDNHATRKLVAEYCHELRDICLISAGNDGVGAEGSSGKTLNGTYGSCQIYVRRGGEDRSPALTKFHPEIATPADKLPTDRGCTELIASVPQILFANLAAASAMLNATWLYLCGRLEYAELNFDIALGRMAPVPLPITAQHLGPPGVT
jgi:molybdopterin/thiamine biosynthesis adenylyltransferase